MGAERFLTVLLRFVPPPRRGQVRAVFTVGRVVAGTTNDVGVFLRMVEEVAVEWAHQARIAAAALAQREAR